MRTNAARRRTDGKASRGLADRPVLVLRRRRRASCMPSVPWSAAGLCSERRPPPPPPPPHSCVPQCGLTSGGRPRRSELAQRARAAAAAAGGSPATSPLTPLTLTLCRYSALSSRHSHTHSSSSFSVYLCFPAVFSRALLLAFCSSVAVGVSRAQGGAEARQCFPACGQPRPLNSL